MTLRVVIVDDHRMMRYGLRMVLAQDPLVSVLGEAASVAEALQLVRKEQPDVVVLDVQMPDGSGLDLARLLRAEMPSLRVVFVSGVADERLVKQAMEAGGDAFVRKEESQEELLRALVALREGKRYLCPSSSTQLLKVSEQPQAGGAGEPLKPRDQRLLQLVGQGLRNKEIATELGVTVKSVEAYRSRLMKRIGCQTPAELVRYAVRQGLVAP